MTLLTLSCMKGVFSDAVVVDDQQTLVFLSLWGQDTALKELLARLTLPVYEEGWRYLTFESEQHVEIRVEIDQMNHVRQHSGRIDKNSLFQGLSHLWLYDALAVEADDANRRCVLLRTADESDSSLLNRLWKAVMTLCPVPLLEHWSCVMNTFFDHQWIQRYRGIGIEAYALDFSNEANVAEQVKQWVQAGELSRLNRQPTLELTRLRRWIT